MKRDLAQAWLIAAQIMPFVTLLELIVRQSFWSAPFTLLAILLTATFKCRHCGLPVRGKPVIGRFVPVRLDEIDHCPRCDQPMFGG